MPYCLRSFAAVMVVAAALAFPPDGHAVPASPATHPLAQPDGSTFRARQWGDELLAGWETAEGFTVVTDPATAEWRYAVPGEGGALVPSKLRPDRDPPPPGIRLRLRPAAAIASAATARAAAAPVVEPSSPTGTANLLVSLVNFSDTSPTFPPSRFESLFFGSGNGSMADYYAEVSGGSFTVSSGPAGIQGWIQASNTHDYYGRDADGDRKDVKVADLVLETAKALDLRTPRFDFAPYDRDGDCRVDAFAVIYQGTEQSSSGRKSDIWPHMSKIPPYQTHTPCASGGYISVSDYIIQGELLNDQRDLSTIGTMTHEFAHTLGLPDLYDTDYSSDGAGVWSLMAGGAYGSTSETPDGDSPTHLDPWSKFYLGWIVPQRISGDPSTVPMLAVSQGGDVVQLRGGSPLSGEYFLVENRQRTGFDRGLPAAGLLIWHVDGGTIRKYYSANSVNDHECVPGKASCSDRHLGVAVEQADGSFSLEKGQWGRDSAVPFPGSASNHSFGAVTRPSSALYDGTRSGVAVADISASGPVMTATFSVSGDPFLFTGVPSDKPLPYKPKTVQLGFTGSALTTPELLAQEVRANLVHPDWISLRDVSVARGKDGEMKGKLTLAVTQNPDSMQREGGVSFGVASFGFLQAPAPCTVSVAGPVRDVPAAGGEFTVEVTAPNGCAWSASSLVPWMALSGAAGSGNGSFGVSTVPSAGTVARKGKLVVTAASERPASKTVTVRQGQ